MKTIGIIGYGRFGQLLYKLLKVLAPEINILVNSKDASNDQIEFSSFSAACSAEVIIPCVPINKFEDVIKGIAKYACSQQTVIDVCSVKSYPAEVMTRLLPKEVGIIATHPMFGPGNINSTSDETILNSINGLNIVTYPIRDLYGIYTPFVNFLRSNKFNLIELTPLEHDRICAKNQFITLFVIFILKSMGWKREGIDTRSTNLLKDTLDSVTISQELLTDMYHYNKFCEEELVKFNSSFQEFFNLVTTR